VARGQRRSRDEAEEVGETKKGEDALGEIRAWLWWLLGVCLECVRVERVSNGKDEVRRLSERGREEVDQQL
jgi:hypothetical protein